MKDSTIDNILAANPILSDPRLKSLCDNWSVLNDLGEQLGLTPYSPVLAAFIAYGMTDGKEGSLPASVVH